MNLEIKTEKFSESAMKAIKAVKPIIGDFDSLEEFNTMPYFTIKQFIDRGGLCGYAVFFLGYNGLESTDASLEDIAYWDENPITLERFMQRIISLPDFPIPIENFYYDPEHFGSLSNMLDSLGLKRKERNDERDTISR